MSNLTSKRVMQVFTVVLTVMFSLYAFEQISASQSAQQRLLQEQLTQEAKAHFQSIQDTRSWNARHGGVYVLNQGALKPNPYLKDNQITLDDGRQLIKVNPAWMTRQISDISNKHSNYKFKITSLNPLNPDNLADKFEAEALQFFEHNKQTKYYYRFDQQGTKFNFMGSLRVAESCMACHAEQGYKVGDIRGGIRVSMPSDIYQQQMQLILDKAAQDKAITIGGAVVMLGIILSLIHVFYSHQATIIQLNASLEQKVESRTEELNSTLAYEQHLKNVLRIITEVNEILISSYSVRHLLESSTQKLAEDNAYPFVSAALIRNGIIEFISQSASSNNPLSSGISALKDLTSQGEVLLAMKNVVESRYYQIEKLPTNIQRDYPSLKWFIVLPLVFGDDRSIYGLVTVFCTREQGFEDEEVRILENMAHDIGIALYSHDQKELIADMEQQRIANYEETILAFVNIIEQRDTYTAGHTIRVAHYCALLGKEMGLSHEEIHRLEKAAILHDIGKVATPDAILLKPGKLTPFEYDLIKQHSEVGAQMVERIEMYQDLAKIIRFHHARYDGTGYPLTTSPEQIPMLAHVMIVADAFDAMTTNRIYKPRKSIPQALAEIQLQSGQQFHPEVADAAAKVLKKVDLSHTSQMPSSELEQRRMAYFFQDSLTGLYNEDYLHITLNSNNNQYRHLNLIDLHHFSAYNQSYGWDKGNELLKALSHFLQSRYPNCLVIRYHGDDFIILSRDKLTVNEDSIKNHEMLNLGEIAIELRDYELNEQFTYEHFLQAENR